MVDKNKDLLFNDFFELAGYSASSLIHQLFPEINQDRDKKKPTTAGMPLSYCRLVNLHIPPGYKIKESISALVKALSSCTPHCIIGASFAYLLHFL